MAVDEAFNATWWADEGEQLFQAWWSEYVARSYKGATLCVMVARAAFQAGFEGGEQSYECGACS